MRYILSLVVFFIGISTMNAQNYTIKKYVFGSSSAVAQNQNHKFFSTTGQAAIGRYENNNNKLLSGFWAGIELATSVEEIFQPKDEYGYIKVFPNPARDYIEIIPSEGLKPSEGLEIKIFNALGECVITVGAIHELPLQRINISHLPVGLYFIKFANYFELFVVLR